MKKLLILLPLLCCACTTAQRPGTGFSSQTDSAGNGEMNDVAIFAVSMAETPYRYGGDSPQEGFDCSGFVRYVYQQAIGWKLPRTSQEMGREGIMVGLRQLQPGDLVFFNTLHRPYSHVGIYVGNGRFVHSPKTGKSVAIVDMEASYWHNRYDGARRIVRQRPRPLPDTALR